MKINIEVYDHGIPMHQQAAEQASQWSEQSETVLTFKPEDLAEYPYSVLGFNELSVPLGHIAVVRYEDHVATIGRFLVNPDYRHLGVGSALVQHMVGSLGDVFPDMEKCLVYSTYKSTRIFESAGGVFAGFRNPILQGRANWITDLMPAIK